MLRRRVRQTHRSGVYTYAVVESVILGYATVRLAGSGARMTSLPVIGKAVAVGDTVVVDSSAGGRPVVRPTREVQASNNWRFSQSNDPGAEIPASDSLLDTDGDVSMSAWLSEQTPPIILANNSPVAIPWDNTNWATVSFLTSANRTYIVAPTTGYYLIITHIGVGYMPGPFGGPETYLDTADYLTVIAPYCLDIDIYSRSRGIIGHERSWPIDVAEDDSIPFSVFDAATIAHLYRNEIVQIICTFHQPSGGSDSPRDGAELVYENQYWPRVDIMRISSGEQDAMNAADGGESGNEGGDSGYSNDVDPIASPPPPLFWDDSDVEIQDNRGYIHVSADQNASAKAVAQMADLLELDLTVEIQFDAVNPSHNFRVFLRARGSWNDNRPEYGVQFQIASTGGYSLAEIDRWTPTGHSSSNSNPTTIPMKLRFQTTGNTARVKWWPVQENEPASWHLTHTLSNNLSGVLAFTLVATGTDHKVYIDNVSLGTP